MAATIQRVPFGEVGASRLQALQSAKNCQNAISDMLKSPKSDKLSALKSPFKPASFKLTSPSKRSASVLEDDNISDSDQNSDAENVDPASCRPAKRAKGEESSAKVTRPMLTLFQKPATPVNNNASIKRKYTQDLAASDSAIIAPAPTPAGRVFAHPRVSLLSKSRTSSSPFRRIDPPRLTFGSKTGGSVPFSIDAALNGTFSKPSPAPRVSSLNKAQPKGWFFDIHEDTADEEIAIVMEHSTGALDLSSDDEEGPASKKLRMDEEKENIAPENYVQRPRSRAAAVDVMTDDDGDRSPLSDLAPEEYFADGLDRGSVAVLTEDVPEVVAEQPPVVEVEAKEMPSTSDTLDASSSPIAAPSGATNNGALDIITDFLIAEDPVDAHS